ncbi:hypothetical protein COV23_02470 [Candidatus Wolfebacteria bacterium CG10_big_fil_rev_8_21_14_0_10_31_9]|uniref:Divalent-cation tolerance protein CutA n=1 Tax=Candidatus Wolfebacteria bacterium CG10_big_fil_rev_8_21_14_0_10_31_9 TaxID=1975070 RepID=A0A2H0RC54_9BACT|nr:MAG: hypothetical protein COV23_02470 [Candidatus Wolfebacteria bacterium CG10_big_fil_rev_8_21_14_0_10_31_9]
MVFIHVTYKDEEEAKNVSKIILEKGLAGTIDLSRSNSLQLSPEGLVSQPGIAILIKTVEDKVQEIENLIHEQNHHKTPPCIAVINLFRVNKDYKEWLQTCIK